MFCSIECRDYLTMQTVSDLEAALLGIVMSLNACHDEAFAAPINSKLTEMRSGREVTPGALYTSLQRLVEKKLLEAKHLPSPERGGRGKRLYTVTEDGKKAYRAWSHQIQQIQDLCSSLDFK